MWRLLVSPRASLRAGTAATCALLSGRACRPLGGFRASSWSELQKIAAAVSALQLLSWLRHLEERGDLADVRYVLEAVDELQQPVCRLA